MRMGKESLDLANALDTYFPKFQSEIWKKPFLMPVETFSSIEGRGTVVTAVLKEVWSRWVKK